MQRPVHAKWSRLSLMVLSRHANEGLDECVDAQCFRLCIGRTGIGLRHRQLAYDERSITAFNGAQKTRESGNVADSGEANTNDRQRAGDSAIRPKLHRCHSHRRRVGKLTKR